MKNKIRKQAEEKLQKEMNFNKTLLQVSPAFFVAISKEGKTIMVNDSMLEALGYKLEEIVGKDYMTTFVPERDREMLSEVFEKLVQKKEPTLNENYIMTKDGKELLVEWHGRPVFKENGEYDFFFGVGIDVTERKKVEQALKESEEKFRLISENSKDVICLHHPDGRYVYVSPSCKNILGYDPEKLIGTNPWELVHPDDLENLKKESARVLKGENVFLSYRIRKKSGEYIWFESVNQIIKDDSGNIIHSVSSSRNIIEQKKAEEELKKYQEHLEEIVKERTEELEEKNKELKRYNKLFVGREFRIKELRDRVKEMEKQIEELSK
jgi:PAS domain S-box-containing protein